MAGLLEDLLSGRSSDIYGNGLLTPEQRGGLGNIGLLALAGKLGQLAGPSFSPVPDFGAALGQAAGAYGASQEGAGTAALNAILTAQKGRKLQQELDYYQKLGPVLSKLGGDWPGAGGGAGGGEGSGSTGGGAAAPAGAGGGGGGGAGAGAGAGGISPTDHYTFLLNNGASHNEATLLTAAAKAESNFTPDIPHDGGIGYGLYGHNGTRLTGMRSFAGVGANDAVPWQQQALYALAELRGQVPGGGEIKAGDMARAAATPEQLTDAQLAFERPKGWNTGGGNREQRLAATAQYFAKPPYGQQAAAPVGAGTSGFLAPSAGGGGLLAPTAPNPLSDAEPMLPIARPAAARPQAAAGPQAAGADLLAAGMSPEMVARYLARPAPVAGGRLPDGSLPLPARPWPMDLPGAGGGGPLAAPPGAGTDSYVTPQGPAGDPGPAGPAGPATPRAPLPTMGPAGIELPPMQGPLAAPAPAAAAPAAPGPGLLSPPGAAPGAPAIPRGANPAYDTYLRNLGIADVLAKGAGLPGLSGLTEALKASPGYAAELERAKQRIETEFAGPKAGATAEATKAVELKYSEAIALAVSRGNLPAQIVLKNVEAQNDLRNRLASGPVPTQITFDENGVGKLTPIAGGAEAAAEAERLKPTETQRNYNAYVKDAQMRNQPVLPMVDWERTKGQPDPVNAARIALDLKVAEPLAAQAAAGLQAKPLLDEVVRLAYQTPEGMAGEGSAAAGKLMAAFGFAPTDRMSNAELLTGVQQRLIGPIREPGTSSDRDVSRYLLATPGLMSTGDGRVKMAEMTKALIDRNNELATVYRNNLGAPDLQQKLAAIHNKPLFSDEQRAAIDETIRTRGGTVPGGVTPGERVPAATAPPASAAQPRIIQGPDGYKIEKNGQWVPYTPPGTVPMGR
jgi:hypothetical protein